ncbi:MAG: hypothetical protein ABEH35_00105 [Haloarculaceae archaeon]
MDAIGLICDPDDAVFGRVAERLSARGFVVRFIEPGEPVDRGDIDDLSALANRHLRPASFDALRYADTTGTPTWNGFFPTTALASRFVSLTALEAVGCRVPEMLTDEPDGESTARARYRWIAALSGTDGQFYQQPVGSGDVTYRYYAVDDGRETHLRARTLRSELHGEETVFDEVDVDVTIATSVRELLERFGARALTVDFVRESGEYYAVDVDPTPSFVGSGMDRILADSLASLTTIGA